jgi:hypothetical protein
MIKILRMLALLLIIAGVVVGSAQAAPFEENTLQAEDTFDLSILGAPLATKQQCIHFLLRHNSFPLLTVSVEQLVDYYWEEASLEGIRPDVAFAQAIHETGYFRYGGDVVPFQNNFAGIGTTGNRVKGYWFTTAQEGVTAQIQHLLAYTSTRPPKKEIVDPRYHLVTTSQNFGKAVVWTDLNGRWAVPGTTYGQMILAIHQRILCEKK